jgi:undecaprenyl-diphosphatase
MDTRVALAFQRFDRAELRLCRCLNRSSGCAGIRSFFVCVSWLGDGKFWYGLTLLLPVLYGSWLAAAQMAATGAVGLALYKLIKHRAVRERPFISHTAIQCAAAPLDRYSFPSGHTLHAVCFSWIASAWHPDLALPLASFALLVALSRVILGLHYPTDVAAGALLGGGLAVTSLAILAPA